MNKIFIILIAIFCNTGLFAGDWTNGGGNEKRNGLSDIPGPNAATVFWQGTDNGLFGTQVYIEANKLVTMRFISLTNAPVVCHDLYTGQFLWSKDVTYGAGRSVPLGIKNGNVYVVRYTESNNDSLIALNVVNGERVWATKPGIAT
jgi:outer membrane protein assembly factor BamB